MPGECWKQDAYYGAGFHRKADHFTGSDGKYVRAISDLRNPTSIYPRAADCLRAGGRRSTDRVGCGVGKNAGDMKARHKCLVAFAWVAVIACWFGCMALVAMLRSIGLL